MADFDSYDFLEKINPAESAITAGFSIDSAEAVGPYYIEVDDWPGDIHAAIREVLGTTEQQPADGGRAGALKRVLPKACPAYPWLFASRITRIVGQGSPTLVPIEEAGGVSFEAPLLVPAAACYQVYRLDVQFAPRPYAVASDDSIRVGTQTFVYPDGDSDTFTYADEWRRFTDYDIQPQPELAFAQQGQMVFRTGGGGAPHGIAMSGFPRVMLPKALIRFRWYQIPFDYIDVPGGQTSNLVDNVGVINQAEWFGYPPGSLLYVGMTVSKRYPPPVPDVRYDTGTALYSAWKLCDVELLFEYTSRVATDPPTPANNSWIAAGHNLQPFITDRNFYYVATAKKGDETNSAYWHPTYLSYPFQFLFTDPAVSPLVSVYD